MQEGAPNQQPNGPAPDRPDPSGGPFDANPGPAPEPSSAASSEPIATGSTLNLKLIVGSVIGLVMLAAAAVAAYALLGLGGNTSPEAPDIPRPAGSSPSPSPSDLLDPDQQVTVLKSVGATDGEGEAARSVIGGRFVLAVSASLPDPSDGSFYEVFLGHPDSETQFSAGKLYKVGQQWVMTLDQARDASEYRQVLVTMETKDDGAPEETVLTGEF